MSPAADLGAYFKRIMRTPGARKVFGDIERQVDEQDRLVARRHEFVRQRAEARRVQREDYPKLRAAADAIDAEVNAAREALLAAQKRRSDAGSKANGVNVQAVNDERGAVAELRRTSDPRLREAEETLYAAAGNWSHAARALVKKELRGQFLQAHYVDLNREEVDGLKTRVDASLKQVQVLMLAPEPSEEEIVAAVTEANAAAKPILDNVHRLSA